MSKRSKQRKPQLQWVEDEFARLVGLGVALVVAVVATFWQLGVAVWNTIFKTPPDERTGK